ncbi:MAG: hypothetical protein ABSG81_01485 [Acidimicrobiales bacterium]
MDVALMVGVLAEVLVLSCALIAWRIHRARHGRLEDQFAAAAAAARRMAMNARIADARVAELSELAVESVLRDLGFDSSPEPG